MMVDEILDLLKSYGFASGDEYDISVEPETENSCRVEIRDRESYGGLLFRVRRNENGFEYTFDFEDHWYLKWYKFDELSFIRDMYHSERHGTVAARKMLNDIHVDRMKLYRKYRQEMAFEKFGH